MSTAEIPRTHSGTARGIAKLTGTDWDSFAAELDWPGGVGIGPVGQTRDSEALERSNMITAIERLGAVSETGWHVTRFGHWAVGWIEEIAYDLADPAICAEVDAIRHQVDDYPILDEERYSDMAWSDDHPDDWTCWGSVDCHQQDGDGNMLHVVGSITCTCSDPASHPASITYPAP
jgi:hypothetical protein